MYKDRNIYQDKGRGWESQIQVLQYFLKWSLIFLFSAFSAWKGSLFISQIFEKLLKCHWCVFKWLPRNTAEEYNCLAIKACFKNALLFLMTGIYVVSTEHIMSIECAHFICPVLQHSVLSVNRDKTQRRQLGRRGVEEWRFCCWRKEFRFWFG